MAEPIPEGYTTVTPMLNVKGADKLLEFCKRAFGAEERGRMQEPGGPVMHAEIKLGTSLVMVSEAVEDEPTQSAHVLYVSDCDAVYRQAIDAGATSLMAPALMFWGDRYARVRDAWGNRWGIATHVEDVPRTEVERRGREMAARQAAEKK